MISPIQLPQFRPFIISSELAEGIRRYYSAPDCDRRLASVYQQGLKKPAWRKKLAASSFIFLRSVGLYFKDASNFEDCRARYLSYMNQTAKEQERLKKERSVISSTAPWLIPVFKVIAGVAAISGTVLSWLICLLLVPWVISVPAEFDICPNGTIDKTLVNDLQFAALSAVFIASAEEA